MVGFLVSNSQMYFYGILMISLWYKCVPKKTQGPALKLSKMESTLSTVSQQGIIALILPALFFFYSHGFLQILIITPSLLNPPCPSADRISREHNKLGNTPSTFLLTPLKPRRHWCKKLFSWINHL